MDSSPWNTPLTPVAFLDRSAQVFGERTAIVDGNVHLTYREFDDRTRRLAGVLQQFGIGTHERVAVLAPNSHALLESHYGVPRAGAILVALNTRLHPQELTEIVSHSGARLLIADTAFEDVATRISEAIPDLILVIAGSPHSEYETLISQATQVDLEVRDESALLSINYTSGTTGKPKGVMYHHRGAYLQALAMAFHSKLDANTGFLWTLPMFHCNGWCFTWAVTASGGTHHIIPSPDAAEIWRQIRAGNVTHFNAAPTVLTLLAQHDSAADGPAPNPITIGTGGAPPSPTLLMEMARLNMNVTHLYGLTETYGPVGLCEWMPEWDDLPIDEQAVIKSRQGVGNVISQQMRVVDGTGTDVPTDGATIGEIVIRGNNLMAGYYKDEDTTSEAIRDGWFHTGDLGVMHSDGYVELRDRAKDVIISGGENIASIEVEQAIVSLSGISEAAVVAAPDDLWGEIPVAFVDSRPGEVITRDEIIEHVQGRLGRFKAPKIVIFSDLPKTSTGKIKKHVLRQRATEFVASAEHVASNPPPEDIHETAETTGDR